MISNWTAAPVGNYVHVETADLYRPNARFTTETQGYQVLTPFGKLGYSQGFAQGSRSALPFLERRLADINLKHKTKYALHWRVLNAADYGVPQRRRRAILVARRDGESSSWPDPTHDHEPCRSWDAIGDLKPANGGPPPGEWGALLKSIPEGWNYQWLTEKGKGRRLFGYRTKFWSFLLKLSKNQPS